MVANDLPLTQGLLLRQFLQGRIAQLERERQALRGERATLEGKLAPKGQALHEAITAARGDVQAISVAVEEQGIAALARATHQGETVRAEIAHLCEEGERLKEQLGNLLAALRGHYGQAERQTVRLLHEARQLQGDLTGQVEAVSGESSPLTLAERRQTLFQVREQARVEGERLEAQMQGLGEAAADEIQGLTGALQAIKQALSEATCQAEALCQGWPQKPDLSSATSRAVAGSAAAASLASSLPSSLDTVPRSLDWSVYLPYPRLGTSVWDWAVPGPLRWARERAGQMPRLPSSTIGRVASVPVLVLLLSSSIAIRNDTRLLRAPLANEKREPILARLTQRHLLRDWINTTGRRRPIPPTNPQAKQQLPPAVSELSRQEGRQLLAFESRAHLPGRLQEPPEPMPPALPPPDVPLLPTPSFTPAEYRVQPGETLWAIARRAGLRLETLLWANPALLANPHLLHVGQPLVLLPLDGVLHRIAPGDSAASIAAQYGVAIEALVAFQGNQLPDAAMPLTAGNLLMVPGGRLSLPDAPPQGGSTALGIVPATNTGFVWPAHGPLTQQPSGAHMAIDIAAPFQSPVVAARAGQVVMAQWDASGYGYVVVVDHGEGFRTLYAHLSSFSVEAGAMVAQGAQLGTVGSSGNSTGPHLHFEIRYQGAHQNPLSYLGNG